MALIWVYRKIISFVVLCLYWDYLHAQSCTWMQCSSSSSCEHDSFIQSIAILTRNGTKNKYYCKGSCDELYIDPNPESRHKQLERFKERNFTMECEDALWSRTNSEGWWPAAANILRTAMACRNSEQRRATTSTWCTVWESLGILIYA